MLNATLATHRDATTLAASSFLMRYGSENTRTSYGLTLRLYFDWCHTHGLHPLRDVLRPHVEMFARHLEVERHNGTATVSQRMAVLFTFYNVLELDGLVTSNPVTHARRPIVYTDEAKTIGLDRFELGALLHQAQAADPIRWALVTLLGLLGLRASEACDVQIEDYADVQHGHRILRLTGKGQKPATIPLTVPILRALDACAGDRTSGPLLLRRDGHQLDRRTAHRWVARLAVQVGIGRPVTPHHLRAAFITLALDAGVPLRDVQWAARHSSPDTTVRYDRNRGNLDRHAAHAVSAYVAGGTHLRAVS
jgi:integrase/recombinase XerD